MRYEMPAVPKGYLSETSPRYIGPQENINMIRSGFLVEIPPTELGPKLKDPISNVRCARFLLFSLNKIFGACLFFIGRLIRLVCGEDTLNIVRICS